MPYKQWTERAVYTTLMKIPESTKARLQLLSDDSEIDFFKNLKEKGIEGKSTMRKCVCVPFSHVPKDY